MSIYIIYKHLSNKNNEFLRNSFLDSAKIALLVSLIFKKRRGNRYRKLQIS